MRVETLIEQYNKLPTADKARFLAMVKEDGVDVDASWIDDTIDSITEEEWQAMEQEIDGVTKGSIPTTSLDSIIATVK